MTMRLLAALGVALSFVGGAFAQYMGTIAPPDQPASVVAPVPTDPAGPAPFWVGADFVVGWISTTRVPALVTTSPTGTARPIAGVVGAEGTTYLFGSRDGSAVNFDPRAGFRLTAGALLNAEAGLGIEAGFMVLESQATLFSAASDGGTILARPYTNVTTTLPQASLVAFPGVTMGSIDVRVASDNFYQGNLDLTESLALTDWLVLDGILGYRFYRYNEGVSMRQVSTPLGAAFAANTVITSNDAFLANNEFHGAELGLRGHFTWRDLTLSLMGKVALGALRRNVDIIGSQLVEVPGVQPTDRLGSLYALQSNIGTDGSTDLASVSELAASLAWQATSRLRLRVGYSALLLGQVATATSAIDTTINTDLLPPAIRPARATDRPTFDRPKSNVWVQTLQVGAELTW